MASTQIRAGLRSFYEIMDDNSTEIPPKTFEILEKNPFGKIIFLFHKKEMTVTDVTKNSEDIRRMINFWDVGLKAFKIGERVHQITSSDVKTLFGLNLKGLTPDLIKKSANTINKESAFFSKYFPGAPLRIMKTMIDEALETAVNEERERDIAILLVMELLCTFFFANSASTISWTLAAICEDLNGMNQYVWAVLVLRYLEKGLNKKDEKGQKSGCLPLITYWLADKTKICKKVQGKSSTNFTFCHWRLTEFHVKFKDMTDDELSLKLSIKKERMMGVFNDGEKQNPLYLEEEGDLDVPTFDIWKMIAKDELKTREEEAHKNLIDTLEERSTQASPSQNTRGKSKGVNGERGKSKGVNVELDQELLRKLSEKTSKLLKNSKTWWGLMEEVEKDKIECEKKVHVLKSKLVGKWRMWTDMEKKLSKYEQLLGRECARSAELEEKIEHLQKVLKSKELLSSQIQFTLDDAVGGKNDDNMPTNEDKEKDDSWISLHDTNNGLDVDSAPIETTIDAERAKHREDLETLDDNTIQTSPLAETATHGEAAKQIHDGKAGTLGGTRKRRLRRPSKQKNIDLEKDNNQNQDLDDFVDVPCDGDRGEKRKRGAKEIGVFNTKRLLRPRPSFEKKDRKEDAAKEKDSATKKSKDLSSERENVDKDRNLENNASEYAATKNMSQAAPEVLKDFVKNAETLKDYVEKSITDGGSLPQKLKDNVKNAEKQNGHFSFQFKETLEELHAVAIETRKNIEALKAKEVITSPSSLVKKVKEQPRKRTQNIDTVNYVYPQTRSQKSKV